MGYNFIADERVGTIKNIIESYDIIPFNTSQRNPVSIFE